MTRNTSFESMYLLIHSHNATVVGRTMGRCAVEAPIYSGRGRHGHGLDEIYSWNFANENTQNIRSTGTSVPRINQGRSGGTAVVVVFTAALTKHHIRRTTEVSTVVAEFCKLTYALHPYHTAHVLFILLLTMSPQAHRCSAASVPGTLKA